MFKVLKKDLIHRLGDYLIEDENYITNSAWMLKKEYVKYEGLKKPSLQPLQRFIPDESKLDCELINPTICDDLNMISFDLKNGDKIVLNLNYYKRILRISKDIKLIGTKPLSAVKIMLNNEAIGVIMPILHSKRA